MSSILVADDQLVMRNMFKSILSATDHDVVYVEDGQKAYQEATKRRFDLVISDLYMPFMTGIELTAKLRTLSTYKGVPILIVSTENATDRKQEGRQAGASGWIVKPISSQKLMPAVNKLLS
ncbi:response regulator [Aurantivibrio plasticivorans]